MPRQAVLYLRSSKDRSAVSLASQRHELIALAKNKNLIVSSEYSDAVESGKDTDRPGFQSLLRDLKTKSRAWTVVLMYDTSRLGRRRYIAEAFRHECKKLGVDIIFATVPEVDPISQVILDSVLQAMDEVHSLMSREKGLAGMAENVRQGFRAGGRAPYGYKLAIIDTGQVRDGIAVTKSKLEPDTDSHKIAGWLKGRALGRSGAALASELGICLAKSSLSHLEWSALTYAGHTVWNVHRGKDDAGQGRRRPRSEWIITRNTHPALIADDEAEAILTRLEGKKTARASRVRITDYLLSGILLTPSGAAWHGNAGNYRAGKTNIRTSILDDALLNQVAADLRTDEFVQLLTEQARRTQQPGDGVETAVLNNQVRELDIRIDRLLGLIEQTDMPEPLLRRIEELEKERRIGASRMAVLVEEARRAKVLAAVKESDVRRMIDAIAEDMATLNRDHLKDFLRQIIESLTLDPATRTGEIRYRIGASGVKLASPRECVLIPTLSAVVQFAAPPAKKKRSVCG